MRSRRRRGLVGAAPPSFIKEKNERWKKGGGVEITWCKFQELKMYFKLCIWCVCILHWASASSEVPLRR